MFGFLSISQTEAQSRKLIKVNINFKYPQTPLRVKLYEVKPEEKFMISKTGVATDFNKLPVEKEIQNPIILSQALPEKTLALVIKNETSQTKYFYAVAHTYQPSSASIAALFECLCNHHVYKIPPRSYWMRIVRVKVDDEVSDPFKFKKIDMNHEIIEVTEEMVLKKYRTIQYQQIEIN